MSFKSIAILTTILAMTSLASAQKPQTSSECRTLMKIETSVDDEAPRLAVRLYNRLASEFKTLENRPSAFGQDLDVVAQFDSGEGLPQFRHAFSKLSMIELSGLEENEEAVSYGVQPPENKIIEKSARTEVLGRLSVLAQNVQSISSAGGASGAEFAKVFRGKEQIAHFISTLAQEVRPHVQKPIVVDGPLLEDEDETEVFGYSVSDLHPTLRQHVTRLPHSVKATLATLGSIWIFPGAFEIQLVEGVFPVTHYVNQGLTTLFSYIHPTQVNLSSPWAFSVLAGGYGLYLAVLDLKAYFARRAAQGVPLNQPLRKITPIQAQFDLVVSSLEQVARGNRVMAPQDVINWSTNYTFHQVEEDENYNMSFDLVLSFELGQPVLLVTNREI